MAGTSSSASPASIDELVAFIVSVVDAHYRDKRQATNGAYLAEKVRSRFPEINYERLGLQKLSGAVAWGESKGLLVRNRRVQHLEVLPGGSDESVPSVAANLGCVGTPHIRQDIWRAFVFVSHEPRYYYDRQSGNVVNQIVASSSNDRFVQIPSIPLGEQRKWMAEFAVKNTAADLKEAPIEDQYCFAKFPQWLSEQAPGLDRSWKQFRVHRVAERIREWAIQNAIDVAPFFSPPISRTSASRPSSAGDSEQVIRAAIISAARELPVHELQDIAIPIRFVLSALKDR